MKNSHKYFVSFLLMWPCYVMADDLPVNGDISSATAMATGASIANKIADTLPLLSNLRTYTYGNGSNLDAGLLDEFVSNYCGRAINVPAGYILPINVDGTAHLPVTTGCTSHYTWIYDGKIHTTGGTPTYFRTPDDLHVDLGGGAIGLEKTKRNTTSSDPQMIYMQYINTSNGVSSASPFDPTKLSMPGIEMNIQAAPGSEGSMIGVNVDLTDNSTTGDNANVGLSSNVYKNSATNKDWGISVAGYDFSMSQPQNAISYTGIENDVQVNGQDVGASLWDPTQGGRHLMWLAANTVQHQTWSANHLYNIGDIIVDANKNWLWIVTTAGTSSSGNDPTGTWSPAVGQYTDGTTVFHSKIDYHGVVSKAIYVINDHVDSDYSFFDDILAVDANVRDTSINLTKEILSQPDGASIRLAKNHPIDFSGDATSGGKNQITTVARDNVTVGYEQYGTGLNVEVAGSPVLTVQSSNGSLRVSGQASFGVGAPGSLSGIAHTARTVPDNRSQ
ncbi:hypothetical protein OQ252_06055 [Acetobacter farinalis]|uniref:Uncharacterized protein n=1 Tax=Acetobacter farinalis TaxID=1260984 RepID=A0ABT3Q6P9_9PROT|nr:hypothetical protein [Acetobacter farinalis]MCX2560963.1 hypothetical protein [Acetobacter farinalis]NHO29610.1 hypothetical protein [Acetobacter farinalis]